VNGWPLVWAKGTGFQKPAPRRWSLGAHGSAGAGFFLAEDKGEEPTAEFEMKLAVGWGETAVGFVVGLAVPPYGLPPADPTPAAAAGSEMGCRGQPTSGRGGRLRLLRALSPLLGDRGRLTPTTNPRCGNSPLTPFPCAPRQTGATRERRDHFAASGLEST